MAQYQVNDVVTITTFGDDPITVRITEILTDAATDAEYDNSEYIGVDEGGENWEFTDTEILELISGPTVDETIKLPRATLDTPTMDVEAFRNVLATGREAFEVANERGIRGIYAFGVDPARTEEPEPLPTRQEIPDPFGRNPRNSIRDRTVRSGLDWGYTNAFEGRPPFTSIREFETATPARVTEQLAERINRDITDAANIARVMAVEQPPLPNEGRPTQPCSAADHRVGRADYNPQVGDTRSLMSFRMTVGLNYFVFIPLLVDGEYIFIDPSSGTRWVSQYQNGSVRTLPHFSDENGVYWSDAQTVMTNIGSDYSARLRNKVSKSKKKLYRKHPIPEIKDEKHYATTDFIA